MPFCNITLTGQKPSKIPENPKTIGEHIKKRRLELGLFQMQVAAIIGVDECTVTNWEKNRTTPMLWTFPKIIEFLGYDPSFGDASTIGEKLLRYRKSRGMTQKEFAGKIGIDPATLSRFERNRGRCFQSVMEKLEIFFCCSAVQDELEGTLR